VTDYLRAQEAAGAAAVTFALKGVSSSSAYVRFASVEGASDPGVRPQLVVDQDPADVTPPRVLGVQVSSSAWAPEFAVSFAPRGMGDGGYLVPQPNGAAQRVAVPWTNLSKISVRFSEDVRVNPDDMRVTGLLSGQLPAATAFNYDPVAHVATWTLAGSLLSDRYTLEVDADGGGVTDASGNRLAGAAGGTALGDFVQPLNVLVGDATGDGAVNALDLAFVKARLNTAPAAGTFSPFADLNGDGRTNALDLATAKQRLNQRLPAPPAGLTAAPPVTAAFSPQPIDGHDELAGLLG
jgi:hypothetical protein